MVFVNDSKGCMSFRSYTITQPDVLTATVTVTAATCSSTNGTATASITGGNLPYAYLWSVGSKTIQSVTGLSAGSYTVTVTDSKACTAKATSSIVVAAPTPSICMVTVDDASVSNIIYWDKTQYQHVDSFIVYREVSTNIYKRIAALKDTALSEYIDINRSVGPANGDPNVGAYRYKIQLRDSCGNYSALSPYHNTVYITYAGSGQFNWNLPYTIEGGANPVANYDLICDLANTDSWFSTGTVAGTQPSATDPAFATRPGTARWRVRTVWSITCTPTRNQINTTRSNIKSSAATVNIVNNSMGQMLIYPNPASENLTIQYPAGYKKYQLQILNALGQVVYNEQLSGDTANNGLITKQVDVSLFRKGIYTLNMQTERGNSFTRFAVQ
ncbi:MAG: T9SS type A sorting domain-containing protein [Bacteroidetes bacterium]|nr:T9SS type A sorting domain-containing protein [Bacteroidota bacterium]